MRAKGKFQQQLNGRAYLFKWRRFSHVIQYYTSVRGTACKKFCLWRSKPFTLNISAGWQLVSCAIITLMWVWKRTNCWEQNILPSVTGPGLSHCGQHIVFYLHRVEANSTEAVDAPGKRPDWTAPLLIPDVHLLAACCKHSILLVMVQSCENCLQVTRIIYIIIKLWCFIYPCEVRGHGRPNMTDSYLAQNSVEWLLFLSITWCLHFPLLDCFVITNLLKSACGDVKHRLY